MKKAILVLLATSLVTLQAPTCEAFIFDFMGNVINMKDFFALGLDVIKAIGSGNEKTEDKDDTNKLLQQVSRNMDDLTNNLKGNFTAIFGKIDKIPGVLWTAQMKESFKTVVNEIGDVLKILAKNQIKTNKNIPWISNSEKNKAANYETYLKPKWHSFQHFLFDDGRVLEYLKKEESSDVCETGISHFQLVERSLNQYITVANQYMFSQHIIYNILEQTDKHNKNLERQEFNHDLQTELERNVNEIKRVMEKCSTEYWLCDPAQSTDVANFMPTMQKENKQGSTDCGEIQTRGYQCIPSNNNRNCDCIKSTMVVSLALAKADPGYVITGAQMKIADRVLFITAKQAKLLPNGQVDKSTIKPVTKGKPGEYANFVTKKSMMLFGKIEIPQNRFMTAVGFQKYNGDSFYLGAESMKYDFKRKQFVTSDTRMERYNALGQSSARGTIFARAVDVKKGSNGKPIMSWTDRMYPLIDSRMVQSSSPGPLSGVGLFLRGKSEKDGYLALKIYTYNTVPLIPKIPSLNQFPIQEALKSLSDSKSLHDLEKKLGNL